MAKLNLFIRICIAVLLVLGIIYVSSLVDFIFTPIISLFNVVMVPLMLAVFFYYLLRPLIDFLSSRKLKRTLAILLVYLVIAILLLGFTVGVWPSLQSQLLNLGNNMPGVLRAVGEQLSKLENTEPAVGSDSREYEPVQPINGLFEYRLLAGNGLCVRAVLLCL